MTREEKRDYDRQLRADYKRLGLCPHCHGREKVVPGLATVGPACRERQRALHEKRRRELPAQGRCIQCGKEHSRATVRCAECAREHIADGAERKRERRQAGRCSICGKLAVPGQWRCPACSERHNADTLARWHSRAELRENCPHETWRTRWVPVERTDEGLRIVMMQYCRACGKTHRETFTADVRRWQEVRAWAGDLEEAA